MFVIGWMTAGGDLLGMRTIGASMKIARQIRGKTQKELAEEVGVHVTTIWRAENDQSYPGILLLSALADALGVGLDEYIGREVRRKETQS